jgi:hypothetical protein
MLELLAALEIPIRLKPSEARLEDNGLNLRRGEKRAQQ